MWPPFGGRSPRIGWTMYIGLDILCSWCISILSILMLCFLMWSWCIWSCVFMMYFYLVHSEVMLSYVITTCLILCIHDVFDLIYFHVCNLYSDDIWWKIFITSIWVIQNPNAFLNVYNLGNSLKWDKGQSLLYKVIPYMLMILWNIDMRKNRKGWPYHFDLE